MFERFLMTLPAFVGQTLKFIFIVLVVGSMAFPFGQMLPRKNFDYRHHPFAPYRWEKQGMVYTKLRIQYWKDKVPDMSQHVKSAFRKKITVFRSSEYLEMLILETCVAEFVHFVLILISPMFLIMMEGTAGWICMALYALGNLPFIMIQRYNRPRLVMLMERQEKLEAQAASKKAGQAISTH
ncbi:MAG TPA: hypothetical protein IAA74_07065 [Candidatus Excrementavichristensenella intestinipullorum]|nr:hypothetical protein [Candidatus Excrementavichristensenella intestinipullorum]